MSQQPVPGTWKPKLPGSEPLQVFPIWSCTARSLPGRACRHARRCALTLSPEGPHRFTHHPLLESRKTRSPLAGLFSVALVVTKQSSICSRSPLPPRAQPLAGSLPYGVRTFLPLAPKGAAATARPAVKMHDARIIANHRSTGTAQRFPLFKPSPKILEPDAEIMERGRRHGRDKHPRQHSVRESDCPNIGHALIDPSPKHPATERRSREPRVR